jgi:hypothetical protein
MFLIVCQVFRGVAFFDADYAPCEHRFASATRAAADLTGLKRSTTAIVIIAFLIIRLVLFIICRYKNWNQHLIFASMVSPSGTKCLAKATERKKTDFSGGTDVSPIVDVLYGSLYQFAVRLTRSEFDAAANFFDTDPTFTLNPRLLEDQVLVVYHAAPELSN